MRWSSIAWYRSPALANCPFPSAGQLLFAKSSERMHNWLISHAIFGPMILDWREHGAIRPAAKKAATASVAAVFMISVLFGAPSHVLVIQLVVLGGVMVFIWTRPNG